MAIALMLTAAAIPILRPAFSGRQSPDAARSVSTFLAGARSRAMELGRPVGVMIERDPNQPQLGIALAYAEVPEPYSGDTLFSTVVVSEISSGILGVTGFPRNDLGFTVMVRPGDRIRLNYQGHWFRITSLTPGTVNAQGYMNVPVDAATAWTIVPENPTTSAASVASILDRPLPFQIYRQPVRSAERELRLPAAAAIDLTASGQGIVPDDRNELFMTFDPGTGAADDSARSTWSQPIVIMFSPNGSVAAVYQHVHNGSAWTYDRTTPLGPIFLLVARREQVPTLAELTTPTWHQTMLASGTQLAWRDLSNVWVTISPQTGLIKPAENAASGLKDEEILATTNPFSLFSNAKGLPAARSLAREAQSLTGTR